MWNVKWLRQISAFMTALVFAVLLAAGSTGTASAAPREQPAGQIYLYGEMHANEKIMEKECEIWYQHYHDEGMRHLFLEMPYYTAELLNLWMQSDGDEILDMLYDDWEGTLAHNPYIKGFYQRIKRECPETVFHGTDVGHQYDTTGERYLTCLRDHHLEDSEQYRIAQDVIEQGKYYIEHSDDVYRENKMVENFVRAFEALGGENVMGIYGNDHVGIEDMDVSTHTVPCMANQLHASYGDALHTEDLIWASKAIEPERYDLITVAGKEYRAAYFGREDLTGFKNFAYREFWRLEDAYDDFKDCPKNGDVLPYDSYLMRIETGQVFVINYTWTDGSVERGYYRSDGNSWNGRPTTEGFTVE